MNLYYELLLFVFINLYKIFIVLSMVTLWGLFSYFIYENNFTKLENILLKFEEDK